MCHTKRCQIILTYLRIEIRAKTIKQGGGTEGYILSLTLFVKNDFITNSVQ